eukprot:1157727-Pelagomonas_calceolata.AAC.13
MACLIGSMHLICVEVHGLPARQFTPYLCTGVDLVHRSRQLRAGTVISNAKDLQAERTDHMPPLRAGTAVSNAKDLQAERADHMPPLRAGTATSKAIAGPADKVGDHCPLWMWASLDLKRIFPDSAVFFLLVCLGSVQTLQAALADKIQQGK